MDTVSRLRLFSDLAASAASRRDRQQLSDLISLVYDAAIDQSLWENAIESVAYFVGGVGAGLFWKARMRNMSAHLTASELSGHCRSHYFDKSIRPRSDTFSPRSNSRSRLPI